jgi:hypothetical protein
MVDPITATGLAAAAIAAGAALESAGDEAGRASWRGASDVLARIQRRFAGDGPAERTLEAARLAPDDDAAVDALARAVSGYLRRDGEFAEAIRERLATAAGEAGVQSLVRAAYIRNVQVNRQPVTVQGDLNFN